MSAFYGNGTDEILAVDKLTWTGTIVSPTSTTSTFWTFTDHQNSVRDIVSGTSPTLGQVVEHRQYDSFGRLVRQTTGPQAGATTTPGVGIDFGYAGRPLEARTGLSDNRARWYEPGTGKFINEDPSGFKGGDANLFRYVGNDPMNQVDPSGLTGKYAQSAGRSGVSAGGWGVFGAGGLMTSGGSSTLSAAAPIGTSTYSLSSLSASVSRTAAASSTPLLASQPYASLMTTGRTAPQGPAQSRWTQQDREAALRSEMAYAFSQGGLLKDMKVGYDANNSANKYTSTGISAMLTRSPVTGTYYLAFRGTEVGPIDRRDALADVNQLVGGRTLQYERAIELAKLIKDRLAGCG